MDRIASPQDLQAHLRRLVTYCESGSPSRGRIAAELRSLADRVAKLTGETKKAYTWLKKERKKAFDKRFKGMQQELQGLRKKSIEMFPDADHEEVNQELLREQRDRGPGGMPV